MSRRKPRTPQQIVDQTNKLARKFYRMHGYQTEEGYRFDKAHHPQEYAMWKMACAAQELLTDTDVNECLAEIEE